jgi:hypothetical protein
MDSFDFRSLPPAIQATLRKYFIITTKPVRLPTGEVVPQENWREVKINKTMDKKGRPLGVGPIIDPEVINRFLKVDTTPNKDWFDWMLLQAGGGDTDLKRSAKLIEKIKIRFLDERVHGYRTPEREYAPVSEEKALAMWKNEERNFKESLMIGDQDLVNSHKIFGYWRHWPGKDRIYEKVALAVGNFLKLSRKIAQMNNFMRKHGNSEGTVSTRPKDYESVADLESATRRVERFYASRAARNDIRVAPGVNGEKTVYSDDYVTVIVPLTYAAAVRYGWPSWAWSDPQKFENGLEGNVHSFNDPWRRATGQEQNLFVFIQFNVPMPAWVTMSDTKFSRHTLHNLAMVVPHADLKNFNPDTIPLYDEENNKNTSLGIIKQRIRDEAKRPEQYNPQEEEEYPIYRGPRAYNNPDEAEEVVRHLDAAMDAVKHWASTFDPKSVVSDYMGSASV